jgi:hypothetical protein
MASQVLTLKLPVDITGRLVDIRRTRQFSTRKAVKVSTDIYFLQGKFAISYRKNILGQSHTRSPITLRFFPINNSLSDLVHHYGKRPKF